MSETAQLYLAIEGVIGVGKTTLARMLQPTLAANLMLEVVEENPFLSNFYADRAAYAFQTETFFLLSRYRQQSTIDELLQERPLVSDYLFAKNAIFAGLTLEGDERQLFDQLYGVLADRIRRPTLVIYLQASVDTLMQRIAQRDRPFERHMERDYIAALHDAYDAFFASYDGPVLHITTDELNIVSCSDALSTVLGMIRAALTGYIQQPLTLEAAR